MSELKEKHQKVLFVLFLVSGFCSLLYQIVWLRLAFATFGIITSVLSVVLSVFMLGLALGSWAGGRYIHIVSSMSGKSSILYYAITEFLIGVGGILVPVLFMLGQKILLPVGDFDSFSYLLISASILGITILPWCICMGTTIPVGMAFVREMGIKDYKGFSYLYLANVIGAMFGVILTAIVLIELLGLYCTGSVAVFCNFAIAAVALILSQKYDSEKAKNQVNKEENAMMQEPDVNQITEKIPMLSILVVTGLTSMAMEVVWTRAFTPIIGTTIYAFAGILTVYLCATWIGSWLYRKHFTGNKVFDLPKIMAGLLLFSFIPIIVSDPRLWFPGSRNLFRFITLLSIFPFYATLGYLTPGLIDNLSRGNPVLAGRAYAINTIGCVLGPLAAGYLLLPFVGVKYSMGLLVIPFIVYFEYYNRIFLSKRTGKRSYKVVLTSVLFIAAIVIFFKSVSYEDGVSITEYKNYTVRRDYVASVISYGGEMDKHLLVNGIGMTSLTPITKFMAHMPLVMLDKKPESALVICFGMGTTFRSAATWGIKTTAVELVPGVRDAFGFYFGDAEDIMKQPNVKIVIDDGRRYLRRTSEKFDIVTIDPPPPVTGSGSSLLYSNEFYRILKTRLSENGIMAQWYHPTELFLRPIVNSILKEFPHVLVFKPVEGHGYHVFASMNPLKMPDSKEFMERIPRAAAVDLVEWNKEYTPEKYYAEFVSNQISLSRISDLEEMLITEDSAYISDDRPYNEYFVVRKTYNRLIKWLKLGGRRDGGTRLR